MIKSINVLCVLMCFTAAARAGVVFELNSAALDSFLQAGATKQGNVTLPVQPDSCIDFDGDGIIRIPGISFPKEGFSIESRFYINEYADVDPVISDVLASFDCDAYGNGSTEGVDFRVGGGYNYPLQIRDAFNNYEEYVHPDYATKMERATLSKCIGTFVLGVGRHIWKEVYSDRCIDLQTWMHMVTTWDGQEMRIFLNGHDATDGWRTIGIKEPVFIKDTSTLYFGAENMGGLRHFNGKIDFLKIHDKALTLTEIRENYGESRDEVDNTCTYRIIITSPRAGEVISLSTKIGFTVVPDNGCTAATLPTIYAVELCSDPSFEANVVSLTTDALEHTLAELLKDADFTLQGVVFIRIKAMTSPGGLAKKAMTLLPERSAPMPAYLIPATSAKQPPRYNNRHQLTNRGFSDARCTVFDCRGQRVRLPASASAASPGSGLNCGVFFIKTKGKGIHKFVNVQ